MEFKKLIKYFFVCGSAYFTALCGVLLVALTIIMSDNSKSVIVPSNFLLLLAYCFTMALGSTIRRSAGISNTVGWICNAVCYLGGFFGYLLLSDFTPGTAAVLTAVFACIYAPIAIFIALKNKKRRSGSLLNNGKNNAHTNKTANSKSKNQASSKSNTSKQNDSTYQNLFS